ncbi:MAG: hypothetical protein AAB092_00230 [Chloroflexota bacterium]
MSDSKSNDTVLSLFLYWLRETYQRGFQVREHGELITAADGEHALSIVVRTLVPFEDAAWERRRALLEELIAEDLPARIALWVPAGADLPRDEPRVSEFVALVRQSALKLGPHERSYVPLPIELRMRKSQETGGVVSVTGGLNPHWAKFTERVRGSYDLDSTELHRLPESEDHLDALLDAIVERTKELEVGQITTLETIDAWTVQRLSGEGGVTIVGVPPAKTTDLGLAVRRNFRRTLVDVGSKLRGTAEKVRALVVLAPYARIEQEGATTALRGYDPALFTGIDFICLAADGVIKLLIQPAAGVAPWVGTGPTAPKAT